MNYKVHVFGAVLCAELAAQAVATNGSTVAFFVNAVFAALNTALAIGGILDARK